MFSVHSTEPGHGKAAMVTWFLAIVRLVAMVFALQQISRRAIRILPQHLLAVAIRATAKPLSGDGGVYLMDAKAP